MLVLGSLLLGIDLAIRSMNKGETAEFLIGTEAGGAVLQTKTIIRQCGGSDFKLFGSQILITLALTCFVWQLSKFTA